MFEGRITSKALESRREAREQWRWSRFNAESGVLARRWVVEFPNGRLDHGNDLFVAFTFALQLRRDVILANAPLPSWRGECSGVNGQADLLCVSSFL